MKRKALAIFMCTAMAAGIMTGCGSSASTTPSEAPASSEAPAASEAASSEAPAASEAASTEAASTEAAAEAGESAADEVAKNDGEVLNIGFAQVGAESDWRTACTDSVKSAFSAENGYNLIFNDAQQKQENQIKAIRDFISQDVDYIILDPVTETGWDQPLQEAADAGIPVIVVDRMVDVSDSSLYTAWIGSDFELEGKKACAYLKAYLDAKGFTDTVNIVDIQGTIGASAQIGRTAAFDAAAKENGWNVVSQQTGEFTQAKGQEVMESILKQSDDVNVVYCENDNEAFGARDAIEAAGKKVGTDIANGDIIIMSFDATNAGLTDTLDGSILVNTECNPLYGPVLTQYVQKLKAGETLDHDSYIAESQFSADDTVTSVNVDGTDYAVTLLTQDVLNARAY